MHQLALISYHNNTSTQNVRHKCFHCWFSDRKGILTVISVKSPFILRSYLF